MNKLKPILLIILLSFFSNTIFAQTIDNANENADLLHKNGQIYLVVLVLLTIFAGIIFYLIRLEKKLNKLEKNNH